MKLESILCVFLRCTRKDRYIRCLCVKVFYPYSILDDFELFEEQRSFKSSHFAEMSVFLNTLLFHVVWEEKDFSVSSHCHSLLAILYNRDCKQHFCTEDHWLIKLVDYKVR